MDLLGTLGGLLNHGSESELHGAFDQATQSAPQASIAGALAHAFNSDQTPPFEQMLGGLFAQSTPEQKAAMLNHVLAGVAPAVLSKVAGGQLGGLLTGGTITPEQAQQISPDAVQEMAQHAAKHDSSIVDMAANFYAQHPTLVKSIGAGALAILMSKMNKGNA